VSDTIFAELNGTRAQKATITIPYTGIWTADVSLDQQVTVSSGAASLSVGGLNLSGTIYRAGDFVGTGAFRIVGGKGGWQKLVSAQFYRGGAGGLKLADVLNDTARAVGETVKIASNVSVGSAFTRGAGPAARVLNSLAPGWWMGLDGVTQVSARATPSITSQFDVIPDGTSLSLGKVMIATDTPEDWVPGVFFTSLTLPRLQVSSVIHHLDAHKLRTEVWTM
jgi:hypothetical protein